MKKIILCSVLIFALAVETSCGGRFQNTAGGGVVSGEAVSGEAVSGEAVSGQDPDRKMDEKEIEQLILSWFQNNHYMYKATNQYVCDCSITDTLYGKKAHFPILSDKNKFGSLLYFAFIDETGEIYLNYTYNKYIPVNRVKILDYSKDEKKAIAVMKEKFGEKKARKMAYCDTIERDGIKYFVYGEFESSDLQLVYLLDIKTGEIYNWNLPEDELNRYINS